MKFRDFYKNGQCVYSVEVFPPKTPKGIENLVSQLKELASVNPSYISVTYGAMGSTRNLTESLAIKIKNELKQPTAFHFTCVGATKDEIKKYITQLEKEGLDLVVALRGDPPQGQTSFTPPENGFRYANELVAYLNEISNLSIAVAGYPEGHIESKNLEDDLKNLKRKVDAGADIVISQLFYDNKKYFDFVDRAQKIGIRVPIIAGIMPILNLKQVEKIAGLCGARIPDGLHQKLEQCGDDADGMRETGIKHAITQCKELKANGVAGIHFYCLNKSYSVKKVIEALK